MGFKKDKALVVFSGGMDSTCLLACAAAEHGRDDVVALNFHYGSKHNDAEREAAQNVANRLQVKMVCIELGFIGRLFKSDLLESGGSIPEGHYEAESMKSTVVPFRNGIMMSIAAGFADSEAIPNIYFGNHSGDHAIYPDCRQEFSGPMAQAIYFGTGVKVMSHFPFQMLSKAAIVTKAGSLDSPAPLELSYSCYKGKKGIHCGVCGTCVERLEAFQLAGYVDPAKYEQAHLWKDCMQYPVR